MDARERSAIQTDVDDEQWQQEERQLSPREQMMEQMGERREKELVGGDDDTDDDGTAAAARAAEEAKAAKPVMATGEELVKTVVDGEERFLPLSEVVKGYQKDSAASKRLEEVAAKQKELEKKEADLLALEQQLKLQAEGGAAVTGDEGDELASSLDSFVESGDSTQTAAVIRQEIEKALKKATPSMPKEELERAVDEKLAAEQAKHRQEELEEEHKKANTDFAANYADIVKDPNALSVANQIYYAKVKEGKSISEAMDEAGKETKEWLSGARAGSIRERKEQRKAAIDSLPAVGARAAGQQDLDNKKESPSEIIQGMRKSRGLLV